jgi:hypothetical protein
MSELDETKSRIDISQWKRKELGHVVQPGVKKTRGSQREAFKHRVDAQYSRFWKVAALRAEQLCETEGLATIFLVGSNRLPRPLKALFPQYLQRRITIIGKDFGGLSAPALGRRLEQKISELTSDSL